MPGSVTGPVACNEDAEAEFVSQARSILNCIRISTSLVLIITRHVFSRECIKNYLAALRLCYFLTVIIIQTSSNAVSASKERAVELSSRSNSCPGRVSVQIVLETPSSRGLSSRGAL